ncbi:hypothetical protein ACH492_27840 [Streptomyces sp. NPDC019443]|uniref:hypothetical protein n=1 Tax=Streptomyces sp. NPDC019443 TaxID=3365061 RepID=UPI0037BB68BB
MPDDELQSALDLTDTLTTVDLGGRTDHNTDALEKVINAKLEGKRPAPAAEEHAPRAPVVHLQVPR